MSSLEQYVEVNSQEGNWAGQKELYALSKLYKRRIEVYQEGELQQPSFVMNEDLDDSGMMRLSYEGHSHYNVVCSAERTTRMR